MSAPSGGQDKPGRLTFEVASIRPTQPGMTGGMIKALPGGQEYTARNFPVKLMMSLMYRVPLRQIVGAPEWLAAAPYDVEAKADRSYSLDDLHVMFQNLLVDRLNLKFHTETKQGPIYALMLDKAGLKMTANSSAQNFDIPIVPKGENVFAGTRVPMPHLCWFLGQLLDRDERPVVDLTGLDGNYDFTLAFAPEQPGDPVKQQPDRPSIFVALREQLGLRLVPQRGPVVYYVIDHVERPSAN